MQLVCEVIDNCCCYSPQNNAFNPLCTNGFFFLVCNNKRGVVDRAHLGVSGYNFLKILYFFLFKIILSLTNTVYIDEMQHYTAFVTGIP